MVGLFPKGELLDMVLLAEMKAMIGPNDDDRVPGMSALVQSLDQPTDRGIAEGTISRIGLDGFPVGTWLLFLQAFHSFPEPFLRLHQLCCSLRQIVPIVFLEKRLVLFADQGCFGIAYLPIVSGIDNAIGCLLNALEEQGLAVNPIIVYTADNG